MCKTNVTSWTGTAFPSGAPTFTSGLWGSCREILSLLCNVLWIIVCPFVLFRLAIALSVFIRFTASHYPLVCFNVCSKPGKWVVLYIYVRGIVEVSVPSQESEWSCISVLGVLLKCLFQDRKVSGSVYLC